MFALFQTNNLSVIAFYVVYLIVFRLCFLFVPAEIAFVFEHREPLNALVFPFLKNLSVNYTIISLTLSAVLCFIQAVIVNNIVNDNKITAKKNYTSGVLFIIFSSFFKEELFLSPASIAFTFLILCTSKIFSLFKEEKTNASVFDIGFLVALASLFYFPSVLFIIFAYIGLSVMRPFVYREWLIILLGFLSPFIMLFTFYFWNDNTPQLVNDLVNSHANGWMRSSSLTVEAWILIALLLCITLSLLVLLPAALYSSLIQMRKFVALLALFIAFTAVSFALQQTVHFSHLIFLALPLGIIASMVAQQLKNKIVSEVIHLILILLVLAGQILPLFNLF